MSKTKKMKMLSMNGRPFAITKEKEEVLINMLSDGMSQAKAARYVGVSEKTLIEHKKRFPQFLQRLEQSLLETHKIAHRSLKVGMVRDWRAAAWWLERTEPERFKEKKEVEVTKPSLVQDMFPVEEN